MPLGPLPESRDLQLSVRRESDVPHAVAAVHQFCQQHGATAVQAAEVATVASELANNLWMHARSGGELVLALQQDPRPSVELWSLDDGPGIPDLGLALQEGYSSGGGLGCGLPGVQRLMDGFELVSTVGVGTRVRTRKWLGRAPTGWRP